MPNGETIGPLTGQTSPPEPGRIGPAAPGAEPFWAAASWACTLAFSFSSAARSPSRCWRVSRVLASAVALSERTAANGSRRSTSWLRTRETASRRASIAAATFVWRASSTSRRSAVRIASARAVRTRSMMRASWSETRCMNSVRSSRSAKPSDSSTTVTTSGLSAL